MKIRALHCFGLTLLTAAALVPRVSGVVTIDWVAVGNPGNAADSTGYGAVGYACQIGEHEVTNSQYAAFLNAKGASNACGIYNSNMVALGISQSGGSGNYTYRVTSGWENQPVVYVSWFDAARFCNWMGNGQGSGNMETGAYTLNGAISGIFTAEPGATIRIPTEDEWYKAAYYDASKNGGAGGYWLYPTRSDSMTSNTIGMEGAANFNNGAYAKTVNGLSFAYTTAVGTYGAQSASYYGTSDQGGNAWEWTDRVSGTSRGLRGGSWFNNAANMSSSNHSSIAPSTEGLNFGFRLASVPEPGSAVLVILSNGVILVRRKRRIFR